MAKDTIAQRITPAHAGKTESETQRAARQADHPRACGENGVPMRARGDANGSPPRMRGKHNNFAPMLSYLRITPAHAGKTDWSLHSIISITDHPRACGENVHPQCAHEMPGGSPPRMRGKPGGGVGAQVGGRITPAHAGKTTIICNRYVFNADHPRACGENYSFSSLMSTQNGSPPRMRGKRYIYLARWSKSRITPAHAGKTKVTIELNDSNSDHPRACGENSGENSASGLTPGSPPRMRGKLARILSLNFLLRITPAHAGKTLRKWRISVVDPSPQPQSSLTSRKADASSGSQRAPCAAPV